MSFLFFFGGGFLLTVGLIIMVNQRLNAGVVEAKEVFELFFRTSPDGIVISRLDGGVIIDINEGFTNLTGFDRDDTIGSSTLEINMWKDPGDLKEIFGEVRKKGFCENYETILRRKDCSEITSIVSAKSITLQGVPCIISVTRDITDRKRAEEALRQANRKLNLLSSITRHDILNSITVIAGYLGLAREEPAGPKLKGYLDHLDASAKTIQHQIEFTREYQEIGVNAATWQNVEENVRNAASEFKIGDVILTIECSDVEIFADPLLRKVFYNFFDNSFRYAPPFTTITVSCKEKGDGLSVIFADDGVGITKEVRKYLFERGFGNHTGLGLFLSREILAITGITITKNGGAGKGASFEMTVPKGAYRVSDDEANQMQ
ncbi:PAS domain-containing sensor histidine kinase [Methanolacinia petrolearia]|uniref:PAS domain-containing sensor histidine kinase n=1 Tax=Methanolacinia petrolearia TaxID=54120 RepID=UPI003BAB14F2